MHCMPAVIGAEFLQLQAVGASRLFLRPVVAAAAFGAFQPNVFASHVDSSKTVDSQLSADGA